jgi:DNA-binding XRE family transcriptional regulator
VTDNIGKNIKALREKRHISLSELARQVEISKGYLHEMESGGTEAPSVHIVARIAKALGVTIEELLDPQAEPMVTCPQCKGEGVVPLHATMNQSGYVFTVTYPPPSANYTYVGVDPDYCVCQITAHHGPCPVHQREAWQNSHWSKIR